MSEPETKESKSTNNVWFLGPIFIMFALMLSISRPNYGTGSYTPPPPRPKITVISATDPAVINFRQFAEHNKLVWEISPDSIDATDYCATARTFGSASFLGVSCRATIKQATDEVIEQFASRNISVGSDKR